ncbi:hypothetical protein CJU94_31470 [Paraburkholderia aromaticivorans]|uniref:DUF3331 domain-containing protein n=2 Tax=Paraburkholderia aromaticivorans TaxID=2026199 RepID=A0A248VVI3_9BURK|nr:DUF3331 domain-containing protein [Paraburkholderia aromaticivorans]ASW03031.1 hypothetical protein CJU94_31470 [Paraburkholderia aromaticivorans]
MMHSETHLKRRVEASREACCAAAEQADTTPDGRRASVWDHVIHGLLPTYRSAGGEASRARRASRMAACVPSPHVQVEVIERLSDTSVAVLWQDATRCRYDDQVWIVCRARLKGYCALSGTVIRRDDLIYKPRIRASTPANATAMILASVVEQMPAMMAAGD